GKSRLRSPAPTPYNVDLTLRSGLLTPGRTAGSSAIALPRLRSFLGRMDHRSSGLFWETEPSDGMALGDELDGDPEPAGETGWRAEPAEDGAIRPEGACGCGPLPRLRARRAAAGLGQLGWEHQAVGRRHGPAAGQLAGARRLGPRHRLHARRSGAGLRGK